MDVRGSGGSGRSEGPRPRDRRLYTRGCDGRGRSEEAPAPGPEEKAGEGSLVSVLMFMCECSGVLCWCLILMFVDQ